MAERDSQTRNFIGMSSFGPNFEEYENIFLIFEQI